jgi:membrane protein DedA with SNARE-associated domain
VIDEPTAGPIPADSTRQAATSEGTEPGASAAVGTRAEGADAEKSPWDDPRLPWSGKPGKADIACWAAIVGSGIYLLAILPFRAALVGTHPILGELANGATESIIAAAAFARVGRASLAVAILVAFPGAMKFDPIWWWAGRLWGEKIVLLISGRRTAGPKYLARVRKWGWRFSWPAVIVSPFLPIPNSIIYVVVGSAGMSLGTFLILDLIGSALWIGLLIGLGYELGQRAVNIAETISHYSLWVSLGLVALVLAGQYWGSWRRKS